MENVRRPGYDLVALWGRLVTGQGSEPSGLIRR